MKIFLAAILTILLNVANVNAYALEHEDHINSYITAYENAIIGDYSLIKTKIKFLMNAQRLKIDPINLDCFARAVYLNSQVYNISPDIIISVIFIESGFNHNSKGDGHKVKNKTTYWSFGPMQVHMKYWGKTLKKAGVCQSDLLTYKYGTIVGCYILKYNINKYGLKHGVARYNGSAIYARKVFHLTNKLKNIKGGDYVRESKISRRYNQNL